MKRIRICLPKLLVRGHNFVLVELLTIDPIALDLPTDHLQSYVFRLSGLHKTVSWGERAQF